MRPSYLVFLTLQNLLILRDKRTKTPKDMSYNEVIKRINSAKFNNIKVLSLSDLDLKEIPKELSKVTYLEGLDLSRNQIREIKGLEKLSNLTKLDLSFNEIKEIKGLEKLTKLETLNLESNQIEEIKGLESLKNLEKLNLMHNRISKLDLGILHLNLPIEYDDYFYNPDKILLIYGNPLISPPPEIVQQGNDAIRRYLEALEKNKVIKNYHSGAGDIIIGDKITYHYYNNDYHYEAKLLILGESGAGKTTLAKKIKEGINASMPTEDDTTRGIEVSKCTFNPKTQTNEEYSNIKDEELDGIFQNKIVYEVKNPQFKMNIWDFGGQEIYHSTHQFFLSQRALYVLVTDGRKQNTHLNYWCQVVELLGENSPMLIVENQKQGHTLTALNFEGYKERFGFICTPMLRSNFLTTEGLPQVIEEIKHRIQTLPGIGTRLPRSWFNIRARIEEEAQKKDYISEDDYVKICEEEGLNDIDALHLSKDYLHPVGVLLHFQDNPILRNYVILNNAWATDAVYAVLLSDHIVKETQGHFTYQDAESVWSDAKYRRRVDFLLELMKKFELCYELENTKRYIAPQLLPSSPPAYTLREGKKVRIIYEYDFLPKGLLNRLTVRLHEHIADQKWVWQQGVVLQLDDNQAEVIESYDNKKIEINAVGEEPKEILTEIVRELDKLNRTFEKIRVDKKVPCNCPMCSRSQTPYFFSYDSLIRRHRKNKNTIECDISYQDVKVLDLLLGILNEVPEINSKKIFFSYSKHDKDLRDELEKHLSSLKRNQKIETWHDRDMYAGDEWHPTIIEKLESADIILLLVSANFMATDYIMNEEVPRALERASNKKCIVIPVLVKPCVWENMPFAKFLALPDKGKAVTQYTDRDEAWTLVAKGIDAIVKG